MYDDQPLQGIGKQSQPVWVKVWGLIYAFDILIQNQKKQRFGNVCIPEQLWHCLSCCCPANIIPSYRKEIGYLHLFTPVHFFDAPMIYKQGRSEPPCTHLLVAAGGFGLLFSSPNGMEAANILQHLLPSSL